MKKLLSLLFLLPSLAFGQFASVDNVTLSSVSTGDEVTRWLDEEYPGAESEPYPENYIYADGTSLNSWSPGDIPDGFDGIWIVHTNKADASAVNASLVSFTISGRSQVCVLWPDGVTPESWIATSGYLNNGRTISAANNTYAMYCAMKDAGALAFGNSGDPMYLVTVAPAWRAQPTELLPPNNEEGYVAFSASAYEIPENATTGDTIKFRRILSSVGAVSVDVDDDAASTTCNTADFNFALVPTTPSATDPVTGSWADSELGNIFLNVAVADVSADCIIVFEFENLQGGLQAYTERQTATVTIRDGTPSTAGDLFVEIGGSGDDANPCTTGTPCLTIARAASQAVPGDTIEIQVSGTGTGTYTECTTITSAQSGESGSEISLQVRSGDTVNFYPSSACQEVFGFDAASYWKIDGSVGAMVCGDQSEWSNADAGTGYTHEMCIHGYNGANHIEISNLTVFGGGINDFTCNRVDQTTDNWYIHDNTFSLCGTNLDTAGLGNDGNDRGDLLQVAGEYHVIEDNSFSLGGHDPLGFYGHYSVIRGNTFDGDWTSKSTGSPGSRAASYIGGSDLRKGTAPYGPTLIEKNIHINADYSDTAANPTVKISGFNVIYRQNMHCENNGYGLRLPSNAGGYSQDFTNQQSRIYNNTFKNDEMFLSTLDDNALTINNLKDHRFVNNLADNMAAQNFGDGTDNETLLIFWRAIGSLRQGCPDDWHCAIFRNNWIHSTGYNVRMRLPANTVTWPTNVESQWPNVFSDSATTRATFSGYTDASDCNATGLAITGNGVGEGAYLTTVTAASSGTTVTLEDTHWFWDANGLSYYGEVADYVQFQDAGGGNARIRQIVSKDSGTQLTLDSAVTVAIGDEVRLVESDGSTVVDNMGAVQ